jgi:hypothetical protein
MPLTTALFPDPPRRIPRHRAMSVLLRSAHLVAFGGLLGGHVFDVEPPRLVPWLGATIVTGAGMMALEMASTLDWLGTGKGLAVLAKLGLLGLVPVVWERRVAILVAVTVLAGVAAHMPRQFRHHQVIRLSPPRVGS